MEKLVDFENSLYSKNPQFDMVEILDMAFWVNRLITLPCLRPFCLDHVVRLCCEYCSNIEFREMILKAAMDYCPVLVYRMYKCGVFSFQDIEHHLSNELYYIHPFYFRKCIDNFNKYIETKIKPLDNQDLSECCDNDIDLMIEYGFKPSSAEYCMKYDDLEGLTKVLSDSQQLILPERAKWSQFEWTKKPSFLDYLSFSGYFGSVKCFKHLMMIGYSINDNVRQSVIFSGDFDLFHLVNSGVNDFSSQIGLAAGFCHISLLEFLINNEGNVDSLSPNVIYIFLMKHPFNMPSH